MRRRSLIAIAAGLVLALGSGAVIAQIEGGDRGVAPIDSSGSYEVSGVTVDVAASTAEQARYGGWRLAQRKAWAQLTGRLGQGGTGASDGMLDTLVSGIVVENEQIGPKRYIARLGVLFDRTRTASLLGITAYGTRSPPMLVIPVEWSGGVAQVFEQRSEWQAAWARFRTANSAIDYVRPSGTGADPLLLNLGQTERPGRGWWRKVLDQYGASDILIPTVALYRQWPGGPVIGVFQARYGPDNRLLGSVTLRVGSAAGLAQLLDAGVKRLDDLYANGLRGGLLSLDPSLMPLPQPSATPADDDAGEDDLAGVIQGLPADGATQSAAITVQFDTPTSSAVANIEAAMRGLPGVRSAQTTSLALGGVSLMRVSFDGDPEAFRAALVARGFQVFGSGQTIRIRRAALAPPEIPGDGQPAG